MALERIAVERQLNGFVAHRFSRTVDRHRPSPVSPTLGTVRTPGGAGRPPVNSASVERAAPHVARIFGRALVWPRPRLASSSAARCAAARPAFSRHPISRTPASPDTCSVHAPSSDRRLLQRVADTRHQLRVELPDLLRGVLAPMVLQQHAGGAAAGVLGLHEGRGRRRRLAPAAAERPPISWNGVHGRSRYSNGPAVLAFSAGHGRAVLRVRNGWIDRERPDGA
jgi:hypothetical protein